jgi:hypothetical protein
LFVIVVKAVVAVDVVVVIFDAGSTINMQEQT